MDTLFLWIMGYKHRFHGRLVFHGLMDVSRCGVMKIERRKVVKKPFWWWFRNKIACK